MTEKILTCECGSTFNAGTGRGAHLRKKCDDCKYNPVKTCESCKQEIPLVEGKRRRSGLCDPCKAAEPPKITTRMCKCGKVEVEGNRRICDDCKESGQKFKKSDDGNYVEISDHEFNEIQRAERQRRADEVVADLMFRLELAGKTLKQNPR